MHIHFLTYSATMRKMEKKGGETEGMEMEAEKGKERPEKIDPELESFILAAGDMNENNPNGISAIFSTL